MTGLSRRDVLRRSLALGAMGCTAAPALLRAAEQAPKRKMTIDLVCGAIGVRANLRQAIDLAAKHRFESLAPDGHELGKLTGDEVYTLQQDLKQRKLVWGAAGLPVQFREDEATFTADMKRLTSWAMAMDRAGARRVGTWLLPCHDSLTYTANFRQHVQRLRLAAKILQSYNLRLGLEYVGPKTFWTKTRHPFIHSMAETRELIAEIDMDNVGLLLDSWHWYCAGESAEDITRLKNEDVVAVDLNDAPPGIDRDKQMDQRRELPATTGVIDVKTFLNSLTAIGYDGPVRAEPFNPSLNAMEDDQAVAATAGAMKRAFALIGA
jgi:sugar phosphate isomerase/epimerase